MQEQIFKLKNHVKELIQNDDFIHKSWFLKYHLEIVEKVAFELCDIYKNANKDIVQVMIWMHDYWKLIDFENQYNLHHLWYEKMLELWFSEDFSKMIKNYVMKLDEKDNLSSDETPIEIKIVSSSDWASHMIWPFFKLWWYENWHKDFEELMNDNMIKLEKDWNYKIVLPEVKEKFLDRYNFLKEQFWIFPNDFLKWQK